MPNKCTCIQSGHQVHQHQGWRQSSGKHAYSSSRCLAWHDRKLRIPGFLNQRYGPILAISTLTLHYFLAQQTRTSQDTTERDTSTPPETTSLGVFWSACVDCNWERNPCVLKPKLHYHCQSRKLRLQLSIEMHKSLVRRLGYHQTQHHFFKDAAASEGVMRINPTASAADDSSASTCSPQGMNEWNKEKRMARNPQEARAGRPLWHPLEGPSGPSYVVRNSLV